MFFGTFCTSYSITRLAAPSTSLKSLTDHQLWLVATDSAECEVLALYHYTSPQHLLAQLEFLGEVPGSALGFGHQYLDR